MSKQLVIVESPAKAKTIERYLGSDFKVLSSIGHIRSIPKKTKDGTPPIDIDNGFKTQYEIDSDKKKTIAALKNAVKSAESVWLATDEDREGEAIAWHLCEVLKLDPKTTKRIVFHEITKSAIDKAIKTPRVIDMSLVEAQQARQILDRIVGFELSPVVWQKVPGGKSAGRVQSPAVRLIVEHEREITAFSASSEFKVSAVFEKNGQDFKAELNTRFQTEDEAHRFLESLINASYQVSAVDKKSGSRNPSAPFTTSTLQQEANARLGFSSKSTMSAAQKLYQAGKITYMRTDSVNLSGQAIASIASFIEKTYGKNYSTVRKFKTKNQSAQEAHEAIRPTDIALESASSNEYEQKLYDLIRKRTLASQMSVAKIETTLASIVISNQSPIFEAKGQIIIFDGFLKVYGSSKEEILPKIAVGDELTAINPSAKQIFQKAPARYSEGSLVKKLEDLGIGRPSTYATIIDTVQTRGYVEKGESDGDARQSIILTLEGGSITRELIEEKTGSNKGKLIPTPSGELIADFLTKYFENIVDYKFTATVEADFDAIASAKLARNDMLEKFYKPFHDLITKSSDIDRSTVGASREIGLDPKTGRPIFARFGRFGPMLQLGSKDDADKPEFAPLPKGEKIETITLETAIEAFKLPRLLGETPDGKSIRSNIGRFGPFIQVGTKTKTVKPVYVSLKDDDPYEISLERALDLYNDKLKLEAEKTIQEFSDGLKILNGRFGAYVTDGTKNAKIPKGEEPSKLSHEEAQVILKSAPTKKKYAKPQRKSKK